MEDVIDPGPIPYAAIELYGDPDLEHGLRHAGFEPDQTTYRLIDIPLKSINDAASMPWPRLGLDLANAIGDGAVLPPIVVMRNYKTWAVRHTWALLDGVNRTNAYVVLGRERIRAYEVLQD